MKYIWVVIQVTGFYEDVAWNPVGAFQTEEEMNAKLAVAEEGCYERYKVSLGELSPGGNNET